ncbi:HEAT repeat domain-containing protein [Okeania sp.]|uniref:HEAT repeat domain-containing protein n=1 Tax=Okeania sp. TaxID=3100323 RepID=UPI002B4B2290|nr:HEAT repeat domain-containing protein [Okeania sp.]MEB3341466.1 HEAT repeat domain-containing protein [Okeania sp.]
MLQHKSTLFIVTWLTFCCFSPTASKAIIYDSTTGAFSNHTFTKTANLQKSHQNYPVPLYLAQDNNSEEKETKPEEAEKKKSNSSSSVSKVPKKIRSILKSLGGRKTLFLLSMISVLVTATAVFILLKLFDDNQPEEQEPEDLSPSEEISEVTLPDSENNYSHQWPEAAENPFMANLKNYSDGTVPISPNSFQQHHQDIEVEKYPIVDSHSLINKENNNNYEQPETQENYIVQDANNTNQQNNYPVLQVNIVEQLINELQNFDPKKRHQAIWELGQKGDSRAVQPLVNLLISSDSKQQSLILATLSEISVRTLKPMSRALAISLQNDNAEVRKNAIRDLTRIYELMIPITNLLQQAEYDQDIEVEQTAKWALQQLNRIHTR